MLLYNRQKMSLNESNNYNYDMFNQIILEKAILLKTISKIRANNKSYTINYFLGVCFVSAENICFIAIINI